MESYPHKGVKWWRATFVKMCATTPYMVAKATMCLSLWLECRMHFYSSTFYFYFYYYFFKKIIFLSIFCCKFNEHIIEFVSTCEFYSNSIVNSLIHYMEMFER